MSELSHPEWFKSLAEAYCQLAHNGADMRAAANALETVRDVVTLGTNDIAALDTIDEQIGKAEPRLLLPVLVEFRQLYANNQVAQETRRLRNAFERDPMDGWMRWLKAYIACVTGSSWRTKFGYLLAQEALQWSPVAEWSVPRIRTSARAVYYERWPLVYDWFGFLVQQEVSPTQRARLLVSLAGIQLYNFSQPTKARKLLDQAREAHAEDYQVIMGWGGYWLQKNKLEEAKKCFDELMSLVPDLPDGCLRLGDYFAATAELSSAEDCFAQAILKNPGYTDGYSKLIGLYGRSEWYADHKNQLSALHERLLALSENPCISWINLGAIHNQNRAFDEAHRCFERALELDSAYDLTHVWLGYNYLDQKNYEAAHASYEAAIQTQPDALDGYWAMTELALQRKEWQAALDWCDRCFNLHPEWESLVRGRRARILRELNRLEEAEQEAVRAVELEPDTAAVFDDLRAVSDAYKNSNAPEAALRVLETIRRYRGEEYEWTFQNLAGNLRYYYKDYAAAADYYRKAIAAKPTDDVLYSNLATALERLQSPGKQLAELADAINALSRAQELNPSNKNYARRRQDLESQRDFIAAYGEDAGKYELFVTPIRVQLDDALVPELTEWQGNERKLSTTALERVEAMRESMRTQYGIMVPGVRFGVLKQVLATPQAFQIRIMERPVHDGHAKPGRAFVHPKAVDQAKYSEIEGYWADSDDQRPSGGAFEIWTTADFVLQTLRQVLEQNLAEFAGHQEVANILDAAKSDAAKQIRSSNPELTEFVRVVKELLGRRISIVEIERLCQEFVRMRAEGMVASTIANRLTLSSRSDGKGT
jgi:tetratricopeptide (TPR) repeat protein